jgi:RNA-binding protein
MAMTSKERAELRSQAHHLAATVHVGQHGLTRSLVQSLDDALRTRELVKVQLVRNAEVTAKKAANELAEAVDAEVVQVIGRTTTLYRFNPDLKHGAGVAPAWSK